MGRGPRRRGSLRPAVPPALRPRGGMHRCGPGARVLRGRAAQAARGELRVAGHPLHAGGPRAAAPAEPHGPRALSRARRPPRRARPLRPARGPGGSLSAAEAPLGPADAALAARVGALALCARGEGLRRRPRGAAARRGRAARRPPARAAPAVRAPRRAARGRERPRRGLRGAGARRVPLAGVPHGRIPVLRPRGYPRRGVGPAGTRGLRPAAPAGGGSRCCSRRTGSGRRTCGCRGPRAARASRAWPS